MSKTIVFICSILLLSSCTELQSAKPPAQELVYAAELLCQQDLTQYAQTEAVASVINGAIGLVNEICEDMSVVQPYLDLLLKENRALGSRRAARENAIAALNARVSIRGRK